MPSSTIGGILNKFEMGLIGYTHYSESGGHKIRSDFHKGLAKEQQYLIRRGMLRTPQDGRIKRG